MGASVVIVPDATWQLATFNIQYGARKRWLLKRHALSEMLKSLRADFLCLQEASAVDLGWMLDVLGRPPWVGVGRDDGAREGEHVPILVLNTRWRTRENGTFWFSPTPENPSCAWGAACPRICTWTRLRLDDDPQRELTIFNLHLDHKSRRARRESVQLLRSRIAETPPTCPVILCGDFNFADRSRAYSMLGEDPRGFLDAGIGGSFVPTWDGWGPFSFGRARIDYVFIDRYLRLENYEVLDNRIHVRHLSDHHPVIVDFAFG